MKIELDFTKITKKELIKILIAQEQKTQKAIEREQQLSKQIKFLEEQLLAYQLRQFANKSEKINTHQASLFDEALLPKSEEKILSQEEEITVASYVRNKKPGRKPLPKDLRRTTKIYDLSNQEKICKCGCELTHIKDEKSEQKSAP